jgi:phage-related protein
MKLFFIAFISLVSSTSFAAQYQCKYSNNAYGGQMKVVFSKNIALEVPGNEAGINSSYKVGMSNEGNLKLTYSHDIERTVVEGGPENVSYFYSVQGIASQVQCSLLK